MFNSEDAKSELDNHLQTASSKILWVKAFRINRQSLHLYLLLNMFTSTFLPTFNLVLNTSVAYSFRLLVVFEQHK